MVGVLIVALGVPRRVPLARRGRATSTTRVMVAGYVVMRVATVALWLRAAEHDPKRRADLPRVRRQHLDRPGRLDRADLPQPARSARRSSFTTLLIAVRARGTALRRAAVRAHALASAPHRRALRTARHHHARRGHPRHDPRDLGGGRRTTGGPWRRRSSRSAARRSRSACGGCTSSIPFGAGARAPSLARLPVGLPAHLPVRLAGRRRRRTPRRRAASSRTTRTSTRRSPCSRVAIPVLVFEIVAVRALRAARHAVRSVPPLAVRRARSRSSPRASSPSRSARRSGWRSSLIAVLARRGRRRLRDGRLASRRRDAGARAADVTPVSRRRPRARVVGSAACPRTSPPGGSPLGGVFAFPTTDRPRAVFLFVRRPPDHDERPSDDRARPPLAPRARRARHPVRPHRPRRRDRRAAHRRRRRRRPARRHPADGCRGHTPRGARARAVPPGARARVRVPRRRRAAALPHRRASATRIPREDALAAAADRRRSRSRTPASTSPTRSTPTSCGG